MSETLHLHELVFTDREARPAKWQTRCGRTDVPLERATSVPSPSHHYQVSCPACLRVAELEALAAEMLARFRLTQRADAYHASAGAAEHDRWRKTLAGGEQ